VAGGIYNTAEGDHSFAAGRRGKALADGAFVWADSTDADFSTFATDSFWVRASGGFQFYSSSNLRNGVRLSTGSGSWSSVSDREAKENLLVVDPRSVLERLARIPISTWNYKAQNDAIRHMGPTAQDLYAAFGLGSDDRHITNVDADGVALVAIQGLYQSLQEKDAQLAQQQGEMESVKSRLAEIEALLEERQAVRR
jgi:hypothetical protein